MPALQRTEPFRRLSDLIDQAHDLAQDAHHNRVRFTVPAGARRAWTAIWARVCEITGDIASSLMAGLRNGTRGWRAARRLRHVAAEGVAHACGWLPRGQRLPMGSYDPPQGRRWPTWVLADAATQRHTAGAGPLSELEFPGEMRIALRSPTTGARPGHRAARAAMSRSAQAPAAPRPGPHP